MTLHKCEAIRESLRADHGIKSTVPVLMPIINDTIRRPRFRHRMADNPQRGCRGSCGGRVRCHRCGLCCRTGSDFRHGSRLLRCQIAVLSHHSANWLDFEWARGGLTLSLTSKNSVIFCPSSRQSVSSISEQGLNHSAAIQSRPNLGLGGAGGNGNTTGKNKNRPDFVPIM